MAIDINPLDAIVTLLNDNWNDSNTDSKTPIIDKIYARAKELNLNNDYVLVYSDPSDIIPVGLGSTTVARVEEHLKIDIRTWGSNDTHARKVLTEVRRILHSNVINPDANFSTLNPFKTITDLSDRTRKIFRYVIEIDLIDCVRDLS